MRTFTAIDFETASYPRHTACALGIVMVEGNRIIRSDHFYIRPPTRDFPLTWIHGITWSDVREAPKFKHLWPTLKEYLQESDFVAAHNASFDRSVLTSCCQAAGLRIPSVNFVCTMKLARNYLDLDPADLPNVCRSLGIRLHHHEAQSDAEACARIVIAAQRAGWRQVN